MNDKSNGKPKNADAPANAPSADRTERDRLIKEFREKRAKDALGGNAEDNTETAISKPKAPKEILTFQEIIKENPMTEGAIMSLLMVTSVLKNSYRPNGLEVSAMGYDAEHMQKLMRAVFMTVKGRVVSDGEVVTCINQAGQLSLTSIYKNLLDLGEQSPPEEVRQKLSRLTSAMKQLPELAAYKQTRHAVKALKNCNDVEDPRKKAKIVRELGLTLADAPNRLSEEELGNLSEEELRQMIVQLYESGTAMTEEEIDRLSEIELKKRIIKHFGFGEAKKFDEKAVDRMIKDVEAGKLAKFNVAEFCSGHIGKPSPALLALNRLQQALAADDDKYKANYQNQFFDGASKEAVKNALNAQFPEVTEMYLQLELAALKTNNPTAAMIQRIVDCFDIKNDGGLEGVLNRLRGFIRDTFPHALDENDPVRHNWEKELAVFANELSYEPHYRPLNCLWTALLDKGGRVYNEHLKDDYFDGDDLDEVMESINQKLGNDGITQKLQAAVKNSSDPNAGLIRGIARAYGYSRFDDAFKLKVLEVSAAISDLYEDTRPETKSDSK